MSEIRDADGRIIEDETPDSTGDKESVETGEAWIEKSANAIKNHLGQFSFATDVSALMNIIRGCYVRRRNKRVPLISTPSQKATATPSREAQSDSVHGHCEKTRK